MAIHANEDIRRLRKTLDGVRTALAAIERLDKDRNVNYPDIQKQIEKVKQWLGANPQFPDMLQQWVESFQVELDATRQTARHRFGSELDTLLRTEGMTLSGHIPVLRIGLFAIEPDFDAGRVTIWYGPKQERIEAVPLSPQQVVKHIKQRQKSLASRSLDQGKFLKELYSAYQSVLRRGDKQSGDYAPIISVLVEFSFLKQSSRFRNDPREENFRSYGRIEFSFDLHRLRQRRLIDRELVLVTATRAYTSKRQDYLWVPSNQRGDGSVFSHIYFKEIR